MTPPDGRTSRAWAGGLIAGGALASAAGMLGIAYVRDLVAARKRVGAVTRHVMESRCGAVEYAARGAGETVLVSHGIFQGCDGGLLSVRDLLPDRRIIVPSRFGYLGSVMPAEPSVAAQSDVFAELLDHLGHHEVDVIGISAGTSAAVQFTLRHPHRVRHLIILSGNFPGSRTARIPPRWARWFYSDHALWPLKAFAHPTFLRLLGVPPGFPRSADERRVAEEISESIFPVAWRRRGAVFDAYVADPEIGTYDLEAIEAPTLIVHAADDPLASYGAARDAASRIPGARLLGLDSGGHLLLGQRDRVKEVIADFVESRPG
ncbi:MULTISPECIES: alpha/beta fold hydrolase [Gordonia]|uniref:Alpha/beta fold hydrolase n=1 Tax=Gordonia amicalis TaxID=89053 RepID=A0ABU4D8L7_9ACTN|nr:MULTISPECIES: alpha/beta fold hydrolase [Gordonia]ATD70743.1 esterase [Gordonia sp. 1D]MDV6306048.1 alpha/beta fold hydrolase [Gordonia amicalis]MDV7098681.1 alpha/beta fold hydrolase [Gordonia amicalis]MDV7172230.1 alpha/beta fold hydrolase [Gordonia amicalis]NKX78239.1 alpha/beta hydrolase [Gordonia amicalis]